MSRALVNVPDAAKSTTVGISVAAPIAGYIEKCVDALAVGLESSTLGSKQYE